jgi:GNAT superfamily N-acetyltransferase
VTVADAAGVERVAALAPTRPREAIRRSRDAGHVCTCAFWNGELAGFGWEARDASFLFYGEELQSRVLPLGRDEVHTYDLYVLPPFRARGVARAMKSHQQRRLLEGGAVRSFSLVQCWNTPSLRLQRRTGARPERLVFFYAIGRSRWVSLGPRGDSRLGRWYDAVADSD